MELLTIVKTSRPRFWLYVLGPVIVGATAGAGSVAALLDWRLAALFAFFTLPANLLIYGVNDIFDYETDVLNARKRGYETPVPPDRRRGTAVAIAALTLPFIMMIPHLPSAALWSLGLFVLLAFQYSAPPLRAKAVPFLDSASNLLYALPGFAAFQVAGGSGWPLAALIGAWSWCAAMHAYSAIPDIQADAAAGIRTVAVRLGARGTAVFCGSLWTAAAAAAATVIGPGIAMALWLPYSAMSAAAYLRHAEPAGLHSLYALFPRLNAAVGFALFLLAASKLA